MLHMCTDIRTQNVYNGPVIFIMIYILHTLKKYKIKPINKLIATTRNAHNTCDISFLFDLLSNKMHMVDRR